MATRDDIPCKMPVMDKKQLRYCSVPTRTVAHINLAKPYLPKDKPDTLPLCAAHRQVFLAPVYHKDLYLP